MISKLNHSQRHHSFQHEQLNPEIEIHVKMSMCLKNPMH